MKKKKRKKQAIPGFPGYFATEDGAIYSYNKSSRNIDGAAYRLRSVSNSIGYLVVNLGQGNNRLVHRLVLLAFVGPCPTGQECRHLDGDRSNCRLDNLRWGTPHENNMDMVLHGRSTRGEKNHHAKLTEAEVVEILSSSNATQTQLAEEYGVSRQTIGDIRCRRSWSHVQA